MSKRPSYSSSAALLFDRMQNALAMFNSDPSYAGYDASLMRNITFLSGSIPDQSATFQLTVTPNMCNKAGNLHGGAAATLMDMLTSFVLIVTGESERWHVTRTLSMTYLRPVPVGSVVRVECWVVSVGKKTACSRGEIVLEEGEGRRVAVGCVHDKAFMGPGGGRL